MPVAIVTGASRGLGQALAEGLVGRGWSIVIDARARPPLAAVAGALNERCPSAGSPAADGRVVAIAGDIVDPAHRRALVVAARQLGGLDMIVNNASILGPSPQPRLADYPLERLSEVYEINVVGPLGLIREGLPLLRQAPRGRIINVTSDAAVEAYEGWGGYGSSKAALDQLSRVLAEEESGLRIWAADPGDLRTRLHQEAFPGEDISDRPEPSSVVPGFLTLIDSDHPSGRVRIAEVVPA